MDAVVRGMLMHCSSNASVEAMNGLLQQDKRAARGFSRICRHLHQHRLSAHRQTHPPAQVSLRARQATAPPVMRCEVEFPGNNEEPD